MNILRDAGVKKYIMSLEGTSRRFVPTSCQCIEKNMPPNSHAETAKPFSCNLAELAANQEKDNITNMMLYVSSVSYFNGITMQFLINEMLVCKDLDTVDQCYSVLDQHFRMHPPCAHYMNVEYEQLILTPYGKCFREMTLWEYLMECFNDLTSGYFLYGENIVKDSAFKKCFSFCVSVLQVNFEVAKKNNSRPLIMKCLNYNPQRKTRMSEIMKVLDMLYNTGYDIQILVVKLAILVNKMMSNS